MQGMSFHEEEDDFLHHLLSTNTPSSWTDNTMPFDHYPYSDDRTAATLSSKLSQNQIIGGDRLQILPFPSTLDVGFHDDVFPAPFKPPNYERDCSVQSMYNGFSGLNQSHSFNSQEKSNGGAQAQPRQRVRARRGQATDPHSIAERLRRERISDRMKSLQELVPNANKTDKASMLDEIIDYVKFLQIQVKLLSVSRLGGATAVVPDVSSEGCGNNIQKSGNMGFGKNSEEDQQNLTTMEKQVVKLMEEDMGSAIQYLQGKGLCLMPISLATAISSTSSVLNNNLFSSARNASSSPGVSVNAPDST